MQKYAKIINPKTGAVDVGLGDDVETYLAQGMVLMDVAQDFRGAWYQADKVPGKPVRVQIEQLKTVLDETDYKVLKCWEAEKLGEEPPYNVLELCNERKFIRERIRKLEGEL